MNLHELQRNELAHLEGIVAHLGTLRNDGQFEAGCIIYSLSYWRSRVLAVCGLNPEADIEARTHRLLEYLQVVDDVSAAPLSLPRVGHGPSRAARPVG